MVHYMKSRLLPKRSNYGTDTSEITNAAALAVDALLNSYNALIRLA